MKRIALSLTIVCLLTPASGQWIVKTIYLPDSLAGLDSICSLVYHSPTRTVYVGGNDKLVAVDAETHEKLARANSRVVLDLMTSITAGNKLYCASLYRESVWVVGCAGNTFVKPILLDGRVGAMCYVAALNRVYATCAPDGIIEVIDCGTDRVVARIEVPSWPSALCYNPGLNRLYVAMQTADEVAVIDCAADTLVTSIWVRGVEPVDICYDSTTNCAYTANRTSGSVSVIDCARDSLVRVVPAGAGPQRLVSGPAGKVYCGGFYDSIVTVVEPGGARGVPVGLHLSSISYDPVNRKVYCGTLDSGVVVVDATVDTAEVLRIAAGKDLRFACYVPADTSVWLAGASASTVGVIDGNSGQLADLLLFCIYEPRNLCYSRANDHLYCLARNRNDSTYLVFVLDGNSSTTLKMIPTIAADSMLWNPVNNKVYLTSPTNGAVSVLDCATDSIVAVVQTGDSPNAMCYSDDGKVYVATRGGVTVVDPDGDSVGAVVPGIRDPSSLSYDRADNKVYAVQRGRGLVSVIDAGGDTIIAAVSVPPSSQQTCWNQNHNKLYVCAPGDTERCITVIDCATDTVVRRLYSTSWPTAAFSDTVSDKIYVVAAPELHFIDAATDSLYRTLTLGSIGAMIHNGLPGTNNRLYCTFGWYSVAGLRVIDGATDSLIRSIPLDAAPSALAWNPSRSWIYASSPDNATITVVSDTTLGVEDEPSPAALHRPQATVVRGVLVLGVVGSRQQTADGEELWDAAGRRVMTLQAGANDVRILAPGVYFVREAQAQAQAQAVQKIVIAR